MASFLHQLSSDDELLDLRGTFVNPKRANLTIKTFDDAATHETRTAVYLHRAVDNPARSFRRKQLCLTRCPFHFLRASVSQISGAIDQQSSCIQLGRHVSQLFLNELMLDEELSKLLAC